MADWAYIALGSNLGDRAALLSAGRTGLARVSGCRLVAASRVEETAAFGGVAQGPFLNQMVALATVLSPHTLLAALQRIERQLGRIRRQRWGPRTIDLDLVRFGAYRCASRLLTLPHPGIPARAFWRREMAELDALLAARA